VRSWKGNDPRRRGRSQHRRPRDLSTSRARGTGSSSRATGAGALDAVRDQAPPASWCSTSASRTSTGSRCAVGSGDREPARDLPHRAGRRGGTGCWGLELGADDYLTKPFSPAELVARVKGGAATRRRCRAAEIVQAGRVAIDAGRREIRIDDTPVDFTTKEFDLLRFPRGATRARAQPPADPRRRVGLRLVRRRPHRRRSTSPQCAQEARRRVHHHDRARPSATGWTAPAPRTPRDQDPPDAPYPARPRDGRDRDRRAGDHRRSPRSAARAQRGEHAEQQLQTRAPQVARQLEALGARLRQRQQKGTNGRAISRRLVSTLRISNGGLCTVTRRPAR